MLDQQTCKQMQHGSTAPFAHSRSMNGTCLQLTNDARILLCLASVCHEIHAAHLLLPGTCKTTIGKHWNRDIDSINRLASLYHKLDRVRALTIQVDILRNAFFPP